MPGPLNVKVAYTCNNKTHKFIPSALCWADIFNCVMHIKWKILRIIYILCDIVSVSKQFIIYFCIFWTIYCMDHGLAALWYLQTTFSY